MITAKELRVGNIVKYNGDVTYFKGETFLVITEIREDGVNSEGQYHPLVKLEEIDAIELTPEILKKCGFELKKGLLSYKYFELDNLQLNKTERGFKRIIVQQFNTIEYPQLYKHLHQIQNLYYFLHPIELEINL